MVDLTGQYLGRYHILEKLGQGGMAVVYKAFDTRLEREVAIKVIRTDEFPPSQLEFMLKRFEREAKSLARLTHPYIVAVHDYGEYKGAPYLVMPYLPGGTLKQRLEGGALPFREAARLLAPIARALEYAHQHGVVHRDVKPGNILIAQTGDPMLSDFGIAKLLEGEKGTTLTGTGVGVGTPEYMAPEQSVGEPVEASDQYSLGVVFFELVTGRKPYTADTPMAVVIMHIQDPLPRPRKFMPDLPDEVEQVIFKVMAKKPENRYANMGEFAAALEELAGVSTQNGWKNGKSPSAVAQSLKGEPSSLPASGDQNPPGDDHELQSAGVMRASGQVSPVTNQPTKLTPPFLRRWGLPLLLGGGALVVGAIGVIAVIVFLLSRLQDGKPDQPQAAQLSQIPGSDILTSQPAPIQKSTPQPTITAGLLGVTVTREPTEIPSRTSTPPKATFAQTSAPTRTAVVYQPIPGCASSRLKLFDAAFVSWGGGQNAIRDEADVHPSDNKIGFAKEGETMVIVGGPKCSYDWIMWKVVTASGVVGWTPESDGSEFFLTPIESWQPCSWKWTSHLHVGERAMIGWYPPVTNSVRVEPKLGAKKLTPLQPGETFSIIGGPTCSDGLVFWKVHSAIDEEGWTAEGEKGEYWVFPLVKR